MTAEIFWDGACGGTAAATRISRPPERAASGGAAAETLNVSGRELDDLSALPDDWDGEGAAQPSTAAIERAKSILQWARSEKERLRIVDVDADVLGGVAVWLCGLRGDRKAWVSCMNDGRDTLVLVSGSEIADRMPWSDQVKSNVIAFLSA